MFNQAVETTLGARMSDHSAFLTNDELAEWVACELRKYEERDRLQGEAAKRGLADGLHRQDAKQLARIKAIIAGQEAILRDLPDVALTGDFRVTPTAYGGWAVRYAVRGRSRRQPPDSSNVSLPQTGPLSF